MWSISSTRGSSETGIIDIVSVPGYPFSRRRVPLRGCRSRGRSRGSLVDGRTHARDLSRRTRRRAGTARRAIDWALGGRQRRRRGDGGGSSRAAAARGAVRARRRGGRAIGGRRRSAWASVYVTSAAAMQSHELCERPRAAGGRRSTARPRRCCDDRLPELPDASTRTTRRAFAGAAARIWRLARRARQKRADRDDARSADRRHRRRALSRHRQARAGGMGAVYKVEHLAMGKLAAMKVLHPALTQDREVGAALSARGRGGVAAVAAEHGAGVRFRRVGAARCTWSWSWCSGEDLGADLAARRADAVRAAGADDDAGVRRARPRRTTRASCIAISSRRTCSCSRARDGHDVVKVLDFGLAKLRDSEELNQVTARGSLVGTPFYMSPEQIRGRGARRAHATSTRSARSCIAC